MKDKLSRSLPVSQLCNYEVCVFSSFHWTCQANITEQRLIAIEQYRWFTVRADVSLTANTHLQNPDLKAGRGGWGGRWRDNTVLMEVYRRYEKRQGNRVGDRRLVQQQDTNGIVFRESDDDAPFGISSKR